MSITSNGKSLKIEIKNLYQSINDKPAIQEKLAELFNREAITIKNNWFSPLFSVPSKLRLEVIKVLKETVEEQNNVSQQ